MDFLKKSSIDFGEVRDGRRATPLYIDIDLSVPYANGRVINIAGNSVYVDPDPLNSGFATVYFEDVALQAATPFYVSGGFIANVPFTQLRIVNVGQPGKFLRIFYGVDVDFRAGSTNKLVLDGFVTTANRPALLAAGTEATFGTNTFSTLVGSSNLMITGVSGYLRIATASIANIEGAAILWSYGPGADPWNTGGTSDDVILATLEYSHVAGTNSVFKWKFEPVTPPIFTAPGRLMGFFPVAPLAYGLNVAGIQL